MFSTKAVTYGVLIFVAGFGSWMVISHKIAIRKIKKKAEADPVDKIATESDN